MPQYNASRGRKIHSCRKATRRAGMPPIGQTHHKLLRPADAKDMFGLDPDHYRKVVGSGLTHETVVAAKLYGEYETAKLRSMLTAACIVAPALIFPYFDRLGQPTEYSVARPSNPRTGKEGKDVKYEMPAGQGNRAYFPPLPIVWKALRDAGRNGADHRRKLEGPCRIPNRSAVYRTNGGLELGYRQKRSATPD